MKTLHFEIFIEAEPSTVYSVMIADKTYRQWTEVFSPGSYYKGSWEEGSTILFLGPDPETGEEGGMSSVIQENRKNEYINIKHVGIVKNGVEDFTSEEVKKWAPAHEIYIFSPKNNGTQLRIEMDTDPEYEDMFTEMWKPALEKLKELCEQEK